MTTKLKLGKCQVEGCQAKAKYGIYWTSKGNKEWLHVCPLHEKHIGNKNMRRAGGYYEKGGKK